MRDSLKHLASRVVLLSIPLIVLVTSYVASDPFKVLHSYAEYYDGSPVPLDRDVVSTARYLRAPPHSYDSFIFGNSRSQAFHADDWKRYLGPAAAPFHFDASFESLYGIRSKLAFIASRGDSIRNALLLIDSTLLSRPDNVEHALFVKDYRVSGESWWAFQLVFLKTFLSNGFYWKYASYRLTGRILPAASDVLDRHRFTDVRTSNDLLYTSHESEMAAEGERYFTDVNRFPRRPAPLAGQPRQPTIGGHQVKVLCDISRILAAHRTRFMVIVPPTYDERPLNRRDIDALEAIFGAARVADFSAPSALSADVHNFYEQAHFRPDVARAILAAAFAKRTDSRGSQPSPAPLSCNQRPE